MSDTLRLSPLDAEHRALDASMIEFGGWDMPIQYRSVLEEHRACRERAVVFDVSHLGSVRVARRRRGAGRCSGRSPTTSAGSARAGRSTRTCSTPTTRTSSTTSSCGGSTTTSCSSCRTRRTPIRSSARSRSASVAPGRAARSRTSPRPGRCSRCRGRDAAGAAGRRSSPEMADGAAVRGGARSSWDGVDCVVAGTGYTGEDGVEIHVPAEHAPALWREVVAAGVTPAGLGARDTLRLEAGLPLHGHELGAGHHAAAGRAGLGGALRQGRLPGPRAAAGREGAGGQPPAPRPARRRPPPAAGRLPGHERRRGRSVRSRAATSRRRSSARSRSRSCRPDIEDGAEVDGRDARDRGARRRWSSHRSSRDERDRGDGPRSRGVEQPPISELGRSARG